MSLNEWLAKLYSTNRGNSEFQNDSGPSTKKLKLDFFKYNEFCEKVNTEIMGNVDKSDFIDSDQTMPDKPQLIEDIDIPDCWNETQSQNFKNANKWLIVKNKMLGCSACSSVQNLGVYGENIRIANSWQECSVRSNGKTKETQQSSLRKKIFEHKKSLAHKKAIEIKEEGNKSESTNAIFKQVRKSDEITDVIFERIPKSEASANASDSSDLRTSNETNMDCVSHINKSCGSSSIDLVSEMKRKIVEDIVNSKKNISVVIDESTTLSEKTTLVVAVRSFFEDFLGEAYTFNIDLNELPGTSAEDITSTLLQCLHSHGFDQSFLEDCFIRFACDGGSVMLGKTSGVADKLCEMFPKLLVWHCSNYQLELAVNDMVKEVNGVNHFQIYFEKFCNLYHQSPINEELSGISHNCKENDEVHSDSVFLLNKPKLDFSKNNELFEKVDAEIIEKTDNFETISDEMKIDETQITLISDIPDCWNETQCQNFKKANKWLIVKNKKLGCSACKNVRKLVVHSETDIRITSMWQKCSVKSNGRTKEVQQSSLRKKMFEHKRSLVHRKAIEIEENHKMKNETTKRIFRTVYKIAKNQRPFFELLEDVDLQTLNGINMGQDVLSDKYCADVAIHIASEMKKKIVENIVMTQKKISVLIDESSTLSEKTTLIIAIRSFFEDFPGEAYTFNIDLIELLETNAEDIISALLECLHKHGFHQSFLENYFICLACDGASMILGKDSRVPSMLREIFPKLLIRHCSNHQLELSVNDILKEMNSINYFQIFFEKLCNLYQKSPRNQIELSKISKPLEMQILKIGRTISMTCVASTKCSVDAVLQSYGVLYEHFEKASSDACRDFRERSKYLGLKEMLVSLSFIKNISAMSDALNELNKLSKILEKSKVTLLEAEKAFQETIQILDSMATCPGSALQTALDAMKSGCFKGVPVIEIGKVTTLNIEQFFKCLAHTLRSRLEMYSFYDSITVESKQILHYNQLVQNIKVLQPEYWPSTDASDTYGEKEIQQLSFQFSLDEQQIIHGYRIYRFEKGKRIPDDLKPLLKAIATITVSTSECERNFNSVNAILTSLRSSVNVKTIAALLFLDCVGPPISLFDPSKYVASWLAKRCPSADEMAGYKRNEKENSKFDELWKVL